MTRGGNSNLRSHFDSDSIELFSFPRLFFFSYPFLLADLFIHHKMSLDENYVTCLQNKLLNIFYFNLNSEILKVL